jgi:hypothetical protein
MAGFVVVSGKFEDGEKDAAYISGELPIEQAMKELAVNKDYDFNDLEYHAEDGKIYLVTLDQINLA